MRSIKTYCRAIRRYFLVFMAIALLPVALIYLVSNEQIYKIKGFEYINESNVPFIANDAIQTLSPNDMVCVEKRMEHRRKVLADKCTQHGLDIVGNDSWHKANPWEFLVNRRHHIIWCNVFKAASSSWMYNFNVLAGYSPDFLHKTKEVPVSLARNRYPRLHLKQLLDAQNDSITFIIARHPFERLLSAYRDKFIFAVPHSLHDRLGNKIVRTYRKKLRQQHNGRGGHHLPKYPTFREFVHWLLDQILYDNYLDMHFVAASKFCTPCLIHFDMILKFETLGEDQLYLIAKAGLEHAIAPEWKNMGRGKTTRDLLHNFYSQLTQKELNGLYEYYRYDFEIFDYDVTPYFRIVKDDDNENMNENVNERTITTTTTKQYPVATNSGS